MTDQPPVAVTAVAGRDLSSADGLAELLTAYHLFTEAGKGLAVGGVDELPDRYRSEIRSPRNAFADDRGAALGVELAQRRHRTVRAGRLRRGRFLGRPGRARVHGARLTPAIPRVAGSRRAPAAGSRRIRPRATATTEEPEAVDAGIQHLPARLIGQ
ncbi:hypothetical protein [Streptomyces sp. NPDC060054]|uniref:hypothetical protein n=1 Tax=unclassified Streptomyces TaxID=2593676 RepID=UPI000ADC8CFA